MGQRLITSQEVKKSILNGQIIEEYENDKPFPSCLISGKSNGKHIHVVVAYDSIDGITYIISLYEPDIKIFKNDYKTRRKNNDC